MTALTQRTTLADVLWPLSASPSSRFLRRAILALIGVALIAGSAQLRLPVPGSPVPVTGQTLGVFVVGAAIGSWLGVASVLGYLVVGVLGAPVFAGGTSGAAVLASFDDGRVVLGATGGYLVGFAVAAWAVGRLAARHWERRLPTALLAMAAGTVMIYACGIPWLMAATGMGLTEAVARGLVPFIIGDLAKIILAAALLPLAWSLVDAIRSDI